MSHGGIFLLCGSLVQLLAFMWESHRKTAQLQAITLTASEELFLGGYVIKSITVSNLFDLNGFQCFGLRDKCFFELYLSFHSSLA